VNQNMLTSDAVRDPLSGNPAMSETVVTIEPVPAPA
jgi:hypothetical protein